MLKLRKPFSQKVHLHIRQDLLQGLWEKYVPVSSSVYEQIQLVYLDTAESREAEQPRQLQLLVSLVLKNRMMQMGQGQYPPSLAFGIQRMEHSLRRMEKYFLTQLKSSDFTAFRTLKKYVALLEERERESRRYSEWQKEQREIETQWEQYQVLSLFSIQMKEFLKEASTQMIRAMETELFDAMSETEYEILAEQLIWKEKDELLTLLETCEEIQCRQIVERLKEEAKLCKILASKVGLPEGGQKEKREAGEADARETYLRDRFSKLRLSGRKYAKIRAEEEEASMGQILKVLPGKSVGEKLAKAADLLEPKEFRLFYSQAIAFQESDRQTAIWKKDREEMVSYLAQAERGQLQQIWNWVKESHSGKIALLQKQRQQEMIHDFQEQILAMAQKETFQSIADVIKAWDIEEPGHPVPMDISEILSAEDVFEESSKQIAAWDGIRQFVQKAQQTQEIWKENIRQREAQAFQTYQKQYQEILREKDSGMRQQKDRELVEAAFREQYEKNIYQESMTEEDIQTICHWGRVILTAFGESKASEIAKTADRKQDMETVPPMDMGQNIDIVQSMDMEDREELIYLVQQVNHRMEEQNMDGKIGGLAWSENRQKEEKAGHLKELFRYMHTLKEEEKAEFVRQLTDAVFIWQQVNTSRQLEQEDVKQLQAVIEQEDTEAFQTVVKQEELKQLVEETFWKQQRENIDQENITEEEIKNICEWGRVVLECTDKEYPIETGSRESVFVKLSAELEDKEELIHLMAQVNQRLEKQTANKKISILTWKKGQLEEEKIESLQQILTYIRTLKEKQRTRFVEQLAEAVLIWQQVHTLPSRESHKKYLLVEEMFQQQHQKNIYQEDITKEEVRNICEWSKEFLESVDVESYETASNVAYPAEDAELIEQINHYTKEKNIYGEFPALIWKKNVLEKETETLFTYIHTLGKEQRTEFIRQLADAVLLWQQMDVFRQSLEVSSENMFDSQNQETASVPVEGQEAGQEQFEEAGQEQFDKLDLAKHPLLAEVPQMEETGLAGVTYQELWEWGEALLFYPKQEQEWEDTDILFRQEQNEPLFLQSGNQEDIQTQVIRRQIEAAKDRNNLQQLIMQINHDIGSDRETGEQGENVQTKQSFSLVYANGQLKAPPVQRLIRYIRALDEEQYRILVKELSQVIRFQQTNHAKLDGKDEAPNKIEQMMFQMKQNLPKTLLEQEEVPGISQNPVSMEHKENRKLAAAYPGLVYHIREYERHHHLTAQEHIQRLIQPFVYQFSESSGRSYPFSEGGNIFYPLSVERQEKVLPQQMVYGNVWETNGQMERELQYSIKKGDTSREEQQRTEMRMRQETFQIKSAQEQLDRKLKELEGELKKMGNFSKENTDVSALTDQVKRQLYEELHVEKLRRGLV